MSLKTKCRHQPNIGCLPCKQAARHKSRRGRRVLAPIGDHNATHKEDVASAHASTTEAASNASRHPAAPNSLSGDYRGTSFAGPGQVWKSSRDNLTCLRKTEYRHQPSIGGTIGTFVACAPANIERQHRCVSQQWSQRQHKERKAGLFLRQQLPQPQALTLQAGFLAQAQARQEGSCAHR